MTRDMSQVRLVASGVIPIAFVVLMVFYIGSDTALDLGTPLPEVTIENVDFIDSEIRATVRNTGPVAVEIAMADINDRIQPAAVEPDGSLQRYETATVRIPFEWNEAEPYTVGITIHDGTRFERVIESAAHALLPTPELVGFFALVGTYVGIIPVMIGLLWLPFIKRIRGGYHFFLALTVGLLLFLGIDAIVEALEVSNENLASAFNGPLLIFLVSVLSFLGLYYLGQRLVKKASSSAKPVAVAMMLAIGIGLHNFGEGLAIGAAVGLGSVAFSTFLIVAFALHNTTEGVAIAAAASRGKVSIARLAGLGMLAGSPAIFGAWLGGFAYSPLASVIFLSVGAGAIFQVIVVVVQSLREDNKGDILSMPVVAGFAVGITVMYLTSILV